jgi:voltage-gated sodium channel
MRTLARTITENNTFDSTVVLLIVANALLMGLETIDGFGHRWGYELQAFYLTSQAFFVTEILLRVMADGPRDFFRDPWSRFDFAVVALSLLPMVGGLATIARVVRVLRVLRLFSTLDPLREAIEQRGVTGGLTAPILTMIGVLGYAFAVSGNALFAELDPARWGGPFEAARTVMYLALLTDVDGIVGTVTDTSPASLLFFVLFYGALTSVALHTLALITRREAP